MHLRAGRGFCGGQSIILAMLPAWSFVRSDLMQALHSTRRSTHLGGGRFVRSVVIVAEVAMAFVLLVGSGLMFRSFVELLHVHAGYEAHGLLTFLTVGDAKDVAPERRLAFLRDFEEHLRSIPGVQSVGGATGLRLHVVGPRDGVSWSAEKVPADPVCLGSLVAAFLLIPRFRTHDEPF